MSAGSPVSPSFCATAWLGRLVDERGNIKVCCMARGAGNYVTGEDGHRLSATENLTEEALANSPRLKELRRTMLAGEWDPMCLRCLESERSGGGSSRTARNRNLRAHIDDAIASTAPDGTITPPRLRHLDMRLGNQCNLTCRMCSPASSRPWTVAYNAVQPEAHRMSEASIDELRNVDWVDDPAVWSRFREVLPHVEWLHFAGGEPLMIPQMLEALRMAVAEGCAERIHLSYNTNLTHIPEAVGELWPHFRRVTIGCSIDGFGPLNEYIRRPSRWSDIDRNLHTLDRHATEWHLSTISVETTVQIYNILELDRLYEYLRTSGFEHIYPLPALTVLSWPQYMSIRLLPRAAKELARTRLLAEKDRAEYQRPDVQWLVDTIDSTLAYLDGEENDGTVEELAHFTRESDRVFGDSVETGAPQFAAAIKAL